MDCCFALQETLENFGCGQLAATAHQVAETLGRAVDAKDRRLFEHSTLTAELATFLALAHGLTRKQAGSIHIAGHLHDIGKIGIPDAVLQKPGALTPAEWGLIREHPRIGSVILAPMEIFAAKNGVRDMVLTHHERFDGSGYPHGLAGQDIPLGGRILAIADSVAAMLEARVYRASLTFEQAAEAIERGAGRLYDPELCRAFLLRASEAERLVERTTRAVEPGNQPGDQSGWATAS